MNSKTQLYAFMLATLVGCRSDRGTDPASLPTPASPASGASALSTDQGKNQQNAAPSASEASANAASSSAPLPVKIRAPGELAGDTQDAPYDAKDLGDRGRAYITRLFVHDRVASAPQPLPLVVFFHGLNRDRIPHRWMGGGNEGDVRRILADLIESEAIEPVLLAAPGSTEPAAVSGGSSFPQFDFDKLIDQIVELAGPSRKVDLSRILVFGHSGAGCSAAGGIVSALASKRTPLAVVSIDTCMPSGLAKSLAAADPSTHVVVTWQRASWDRQFDTFRAVFKRGMDSAPPADGILRELDQLPALPRAHDATVKQTFDKYLPRLLAAGKK